MRIDHTHKPWLWITIVAIVVALLIYVPYASRNPTPGGGTAIGLFFGSVALGLMVFAALLGIRKRFPVWRIGRAQTWMRAHLWLGFLALPMVLLHAAFHARGPLTLILMSLTWIVVISGIVGAWLQHTLPTKMFREVPYETIYDQIGSIEQQLITEADDCATQVTESLAPGRGAGATVVLTLLTIPELQDELAAFEKFYAEEIRPYLSREQSGAAMRRREYSDRRFATFRKLLPEAAAAPIAALESICEEKRQLDHQARMHRVLHGWLLCHLPLSLALLLLAFIHAFGALRY
jgi:hypothetical protein